MSKGRETAGNRTLASHRHTRADKLNPSPHALLVVITGMEVDAEDKGNRCC